MNQELMQALEELELTKDIKKEYETCTNIES